MMTIAKTLIFLSILINFTGCLERPNALLFKKGQQAESEKQYVEALEMYLKALEETKNKKLKIDIYNRLVEVYRVKNKYKKVSEYLQKIVLGSNERKHRIQAKQELADNEFNKLKNYREAIKHFSHLIEVDHKKDSNQLMVAKSYFHLNSFGQAKYELSELIKSTENEELKFEADILRASIYFSGRDYKKSSETYERIMKSYPEKAKINFVLLNLAMSYEEDGYLSKALESLKELQNYYHSPEFIAAKINHIENKLRHLPGGGGRLRR